MKIKIISRKAGYRIIGLLILLVAIGIIIGCVMTSMPGHSYGGPQVKLEDEEIKLASALEADVTYIAGKIGPRNFMNYQNLQETVKFIEESFTNAGYKPKRMDYFAEASLISSWRGAPENDSLVYSNIEAELTGTKNPDEIIVIGAHYDSAPIDGCRAANDNASGVAGVIELAKIFAGRPQERTIRFVAFANEEPPYFWTSGMGSYVYAKACKEKKENIVGMFTLETIGYYSDEENTQNYPYPMNYFYPSKGNFIGFVSNISSSKLLKESLLSFRKNTKFPSEGAALPEYLPGVGWSDHWSFWQMGYSAVMLTDTATYRDPYYHTNKDDPGRLEYLKMARVLKGMECVLKDMAKK